MGKKDVETKQVKELSFTIPGYGIRETSFMLRTTSQMITLYINGKRVTAASHEGDSAKELSDKFEALAQELHKFAYLQNLPQIS